MFIIYLCAHFTEFNKHSRCRPSIDFFDKSSGCANYVNSSPKNKWVLQIHYGANNFLSTGRSVSFDTSISKQLSVIIRYHQGLNWSLLH